jgi:hypothetical protein
MSNMLWQQQPMMMQPQMPLFQPTMRPPMMAAQGMMPPHMPQSPYIQQAPLYVPPMTMQPNQPLFRPMDSFIHHQQVPMAQASPQQRRMNKKPTVLDLFQNCQQFAPPPPQQQQHPNMRMPMPAQPTPVVAAGVQTTIPVFNSPTVLNPPTTVNAPAPAPAAATITQANARPLM